MRSLGAAQLMILLVFVVLVLDSRRLRALTRRARRDSIPPGGNPDRVGLTLRQIQMRTHVDGQDQVA